MLPKKYLRPPLLYSGRLGIKRPCTSHASTERYEQYNLFDMEKYEKLSKLNTAIDSIRSRYGEDSVKRACFINSETGHMGGGLQKAKRERKN